MRVMYCPKCSGEYREGFYQCADCNVPLAEERPELPSKKPKKVKQPAQDNLATVATFDLVFDAERAKSILEASSIAAYVMDANVIGLNQALTWAAGGVRLQVSQADYSRAQTALKESGFTSLTDNRSLHRCPECQSTNISTLGLNRWQTVLAVLMLGALLLFLKRDLVCNDCNHQWSS